MTHRGTTNRNKRGSSYDRAKRRAYLQTVFASNVKGFVRCYRCGINLNTYLTVDRIIPGAHGGTYRRNNIRPACPGCNSETGSRVRRRS